MLEQGKAGEVLIELGRPGGENWKRTDGKGSRWMEKEARKTETERTARRERLERVGEKWRTIGKGRGNWILATC